MEKRPLTDAEIQSQLTTLPGWQIQDGKLVKEYQFPSFAAALGWMVQVGVQADKMNHHPHWSNVYNRVSVQLTTHDLNNRISNFDIELAKIMEHAS